jgi:hypothetical protein
MDMAKRSKAAAGKMVADCPYCKDWQDEKRGRISLCRFSDGVTHAAPEMWIASRADRLERERGMGPMESWQWAWMHWAFNCGTLAQVEGLVTPSDEHPRVTPELLARREAEVREGRLSL